MSSGSEFQTVGIGIAEVKLLSRLVNFRLKFWYIEEIATL